MVRRDTFSSTAAWSIETLRPSLGSRVFTGVVVEVAALSMDTLLPSVPSAMARAVPASCAEQCAEFKRLMANELNGQSVPPVRIRRYLGQSQPVAPRHA